MSGGVDSSVAAGVLVEAGYDVVGATMKLFCYGDQVPDRPCCSLDSITDARLAADKPESVEICFVPDDDYVGVLERRLPADAPALSPGPLVTVGGEVVGEHAGFARYTIGQRRGLPGGFAEPMYVVAIRPETREVVIGRGDELFGHGVTLEDLNWL